MGQSYRNQLQLKEDNLITPKVSHYVLSLHTISFTTFSTYIILTLSNNHTESSTSKQQTYPHEPRLHTLKNIYYK